MEHTTLVLESALPETMAEEIHKQIYFVSSSIQGFDLKLNNGQIEAIDLTVDGQINDQITANVKRFIETLLANSLAIPDKTLWKSRTRRTDIGIGTYQELVEKQFVFPSGVGLSTFSYAFNNLMLALDRRIRDISVNTLGGTEYVYPTLIESDAICRSRYAESFPHMLMFITRLHNEQDIYDQFLDSFKKEQKLGDSLFQHCRDSTYCLPPTMCYHTFQQFSDAVIDDTAGRVVTAKGKSFRFEGKSYKSLSRLCDFTIRETVFLGDDDFVRQARATFMTYMQRLIDELELVGNCKVGADPFFCEPQSLAKLANQKLFELKIELNLNVSDAEEISVGSFNIHNDFFGCCFNINRHGSAIQSGCTGVGIERLAYAFVAQHGVDQTCWEAVLGQSLN